MKKYILLLALMPFITNPLLVSADEYIISGNGSGSDSQINVTVNTTTEVKQDNNANVENNVNIEADTGNNDANQNTGGDTSIVTGDVQVESNINNEGINQSYVEAGCCTGESTEIKISGNGAGSTNTVAGSFNSSTNVSVNNSANITNNVNGIANTGKNSASYNNGNVSIKTGSITVIDNINNESVNNYSINVKNNSGRSITVHVKDNGTASDNIVIINNQNNVDINVENSARIANDSNWDLNTGKNKAKGNNGDVSIITGDILFASTINNKDINTGWVDVDCCAPEVPDKPDKPDITPPPTPPSNGNGNGGNGNGNGGNGNGDGNGDNGDGADVAILPVTGPPNLLILAIANVLMFFLGWYLRLRSGRAPNLAV
jgi:hypothetical protein